MPRSDGIYYILPAISGTIELIPTPLPPNPVAPVAPTTMPTAPTPSFVVPPYGSGVISSFNLVLFLISLLLLIIQ